MQCATLARLEGDMACLRRRWRAGELEPAIIASLYFLYWQMAIHGRLFATRRCRNEPPPDRTELSIMLEIADAGTLRSEITRWLARYQFRGVRDKATVALGQWLCGAWPLVLREDIPVARDILRWQARGTRAVTVLTGWPRLLEPVLGKPNAFAFFLHDLEHAYQFFHNPAMHAGQRAFFSALERAVDRGVFVSHLDDALFAAKFHYLMSDMNTHPEHARQYLRAILVEHFLRREQKAATEALGTNSEDALEMVMQEVTPLAPFAECA